MRIKSPGQYEDAYRKSITSPAEYWAEVAETYTWEKRWERVSSGDLKNMDVKWFDGARLNITVNCLDRHLGEKGDHTALIWEPNSPDEESKKFSFRELHEEVSRFANVLKGLGVGKGDRVCFYMGMVPELMIGILACARIGAIHSVVFGGFSAVSLAGRMTDCEATVLVTSDVSRRGVKNIDLLGTSIEAAVKCSSVKELVVVPSPLGFSGDLLSLVDSGAHFQIRNYAELGQSVAIDCPPVMVEAEDPLFILYTSGSTGKPKGLFHTTAGYMVYAGHTFENVFQPRGEGDVFWCTADIGWITGHTYVTYAPLLNGVTTLMYEGVPTYPDAGRSWQIVDKHSVTQYYTAPTAIRSMELCDPRCLESGHRKSLRVLGSVGEPINEEAWHWYSDKIGGGKLPIVDTYWQTETGGIMISSLAGVTESVPTYATRPLPGIEPVLIDETGKVIESSNAEGRLCIKKPWPGMARGIWGDQNRYMSTYLSALEGAYFTGDGARRDEKGYRITGRVDDVIVVSGHNIGTAEVEDAIDEHPMVVESAVVGIPHEVKGQSIRAYVIPSAGYSEGVESENLRSEVLDLVAKHVGSFAKPDEIRLVSGLPKTRSGKIMRRVLRKVAQNEVDQLGDVSTLLNPEVVEDLLASKVL